MPNIEAKEAELNLLKAEQAFTEKKATSGVTHEDKEQLRELRREFRENFRTPKTGASPGTIETKAGS